MSLTVEQAVTVLRWMGASAVEYIREISEWWLEINGYSEYLSDSKLVAKAIELLSQNEGVMERVVDWWNKHDSIPLSARYVIRDSGIYDESNPVNDCYLVEPDELLNDALETGMTIQQIMGVVE